MDMKDLTFDDFNKALIDGKNLEFLAGLYDAKDYNEIKAGLNSLKSFIAKCESIFNSYTQELQELKEITNFCNYGFLEEAQLKAKQKLKMLDFSLFRNNVSIKISTSDFKDFLVDYEKLAFDHMNYLESELNILNMYLRKTDDYFKVISKSEIPRTSIRTIEREPYHEDREAEVYRAFKGGYEDSLGF